MAPARIATIAVAALALALPARALAGSVSVNGTGLLEFGSGGSATVFTTVVNAPARIRLMTRPGSRFRPVCVDPGVRCVRYDRRHRVWIVLRPVKFFYTGSAFRLMIRARNGFQLGITGRGQLHLNGSGSYVIGGTSHDYAGDIRLRLA
jgi:hypothetical protein